MGLDVGYFDIEINIYYFMLNSRNNWLENGVYMIQLSKKMVNLIGIHN